MNIFEIHLRTTSRIEPLHSHYLAACLRESPELLEKFWLLSTESTEDWLPPEGMTGVQVGEEHALGDGKRVDIVLMASDRLVAVETKTADSSVESGQLDEYMNCLEKQHPDKRIWMVYLTPFNPENEPSRTRGHEAIKEFERFRSRHPLSSHLSWAQVAGLAWDGQDEVWRQHSEYVHDRICQPPTSDVGWGSLDKDLGWETMRDFWGQIKRDGFDAHARRITLKPGDNPESLANALKLLIQNERVDDQSKSRRSFPEALARPFIDDRVYGKFHERILWLRDEFPYLRIRGEGGYGIHLPLRRPREHEEVSICTCRPNEPQLLIIGRRPQVGHT